MHKLQLNCPFRLSEITPRWCRWWSREKRVLVRPSLVLEGVTRFTRPGLISYYLLMVAILTILLVNITAVVSVPIVAVRVAGNIKPPADNASTLNLPHLFNLSSFLSLPPFSSCPSFPASFTPTRTWVREDNSRSAPPPHPLANLTSSFIHRLETLAKYATIAYCHNQTLVQTLSCNLCRQSPELSPSNTHILYTFHGSSNPYGMQGLIAIDDQLGSIIVAFRGSSTRRHVVLDLQIRATYPWMWTDEAPLPVLVHAGFLRAFAGVRDTIVQKLRTIVTLHPDLDLVFVGHSMGGVMSVLFAVDAVLPNGGFLRGLIPPSRIHVITMGEPRVGNAAFARWVSSQHLGLGSVIRVVNGTDPVPHIPPLFWRPRFQHHGRELYIDPHDNNSVRWCLGDVVPGQEDQHACSNEALRQSGQIFVRAMLEGIKYHKRYFNIEMGGQSNC